MEQTQAAPRPQEYLKHLCESERRFYYSVSQSSGRSVSFIDDHCKNTGKNMVERDKTPDRRFLEAVGTFLCHNGSLELFGNL